MKKKNKGFTLIEMLVVVLIIGILAGIALPQYRKTVIKTKLAEADISLNTAMKNIDLYLAANGDSHGRVYFTGVDAVGDIEMPGDCSDGEYCRTQWFGFYSSCDSGWCILELDTGLGLNPDWFNAFFDNGSRVTFTKGPDLNWSIEDIYVGNDDNLKIICQWAKERNFPARNGYDFCSRVGINL